MKEINTKMLTKIALLEAIMSAYYSKRKYFAIKVSIPNSDGFETIIFSNNDFKMKLSYYKAAYDDYLMHKNCNDIFICNYCAADSFEEIEREFC